MGCKSFFFRRENELQIHHGNFYLMDNKHRKLFVIGYSTLYVDDTSGESFFVAGFIFTYVQKYFSALLRGGGGEPPASESATGLILASSKNDTHLVLMAVVQSI